LLYAITDIETTGSHASGNSIIEIGICLHDGEKIVREFSTLIDPGIRIPPFITALTGIDDHMLKGAPPFHQVADELEEIFDEAIFVAHNVNFDHSFIRAEFAAIGRNWNPPKLCTMRLARKAFPGLPSYGLGKICNWLDIENETAHRALSDAKAATSLFEKSMQLLDDDVVKKMIAKASGEVFLPPNLNSEDFKNLPEKPGVYYMLNEKGKPIYIGKANNLKKRVRQHFTVNPESKRMQAFMKEIHHVKYELTGTELIALLLEDAEIRQHWPAYNSAQKRKPPKVHIVRYTDQSGFERLAMQVTARVIAAHKTFPSQFSARTWLNELASEFNIDPRLLGLNMFNADAELPTRDDHNNQLRIALDVFQSREPSFVIQDVGRHDDEVSYVLVRNGQLMGFTFLANEEHLLDVIESNIRPLPQSEVNASIIGNINENYRGYKKLPAAETII